MKRPVYIYLSGGRNSAWKSQIKLALRKLHDSGFVRWIDPQEYRTQNQEEMDLLDAIRLKNSDVVFANEKDKDAPVKTMYEELKAAKQLGIAVIVLVAGENTGTNPATAEFRTNEWPRAVNMLEEMILAMTGEKS